MTLSLPDGPFATVVADPPWPYEHTRALQVRRDLLHNDHAHVAAAEYYPLMTMEDLKSLPVRQVVLPNAHLYLWTTNSFIVEAHDLARAWGFVPKTILTWVKTKKGTDDTPSMKTGYWFRSATEHVLFGVRGSMRLRGPCVPTVFYGERLPHSVKPDSFFQMVEGQSPEPYLEMFARRLRSGWSVWGNEIKGQTDVVGSDGTVRRPLC